MAEFRISQNVAWNSFDYFEQALITDNGFREYDVRWLLGKEVNPNGFQVLGQAYGTFVQEQLGEHSVVVGHDFRSYSQDLARSFIVGLLSSGIRVFDIGLALTPMVYFAQHLFSVKGAASVTASHNENGWTGLKLANGLSSTLGPDGIRQFQELVRRQRFRGGAGTYELHPEVFDQYRADLKKHAVSSRQMRVALSCGNGTAGRFAPTILRDIGCDVIELDCDPDWEFKKHNPNPEDLSFLRSISDATLKNACDIGIGIDGDGDRLGVIDDRGHEIYSDKLGLLIARMLAPQYSSRPIIVDVKSTGLFESDPVLRSAGATVIMWRTGHSYIKAKVSETNALAGFEKSGHWFFGDPIGRGYDDAMLASIVAIGAIASRGTPLSQQIAELPRTWQSPTLGAFCADTVKYSVVDRIREAYEADRHSEATIAGEKIRDLVDVNGVRFVLADGSWGLVRASSNKPSLVVVAESMTSARQLREIVSHIQKRLADTGLVSAFDQELPEDAAA